MSMHEVMRQVNLGGKPPLQESLEEARQAMRLRTQADAVRLAVSSVAHLVTVTPDIARTLGNYTANGGEKLAWVRFDATDMKKADLAASICKLPVSDFCGAAISFVVAMERETPGFLAVVKAQSAEEEMTTRAAMEIPDIQPWGEEDNKDWGRRDDF